MAPFEVQYQIRDSLGEWLQPTDKQTFTNNWTDATLIQDLILICNCVLQPQKKAT